MFQACEICGANDWHEVYRADVRDGTFGAVREDAVVAKCGGCGVERLGDEWCIPDSYYESGEYRTKLAQELDAPSYFKGHDHLQVFAMNVLPLSDLRGKSVADVGCAGGSFLDHVSGLAGKIIGVEPFSEYHESLKARGYETYSFASNATDQKGQVDYATSFQVIEHTPNPRQFLEDIRPLLSEDGMVYLSTPNLKDILMQLLPDEYPSFFYRVVHKWYFDIESLTECARLAGFELAETHFVHRYPMGNALRWLRDRKPTGTVPMDGLDHGADEFWKGYLENTGTSDCLFVALRPTKS